MRRLHDPSDADVVGPDALTHLVSEERRRRVRTALETLSPEDRDLLHAVYFAQIGMSELAAKLALSPGALRVRKHRAVQRLAAALGARQTDETLSGDRELNE
jgi:RNA polymerase sigma factor (sigma-70 family)